MATIKGQNLRLLIDGKCVAASTSCTVHIAANVESKTTKDSEGDFEEREVTGLSWDAQVDALVINGVFDAGSGSTTENVTVGGDTYKRSPVAIEVPVGATITVVGGGLNCVILDEDNEVLEDTNMYWKNEDSDQTIKVYVADDSGDIEDFTYTVNYPNVGLAALQDNLIDKTKVEVYFSRTIGSMNSVEAEELLHGYAYVSDLQIQAPNRQQATFSCQLTGTEELEIVDNS